MKNLKVGGKIAKYPESKDLLSCLEECLIYMVLNTTQMEITCALNNSDAYYFRCKKIESYLLKDWAIVRSSHHQIFRIDKIPTAQISRSGNCGFRHIARTLFRLPKIKNWDRGRAPDVRYIIMWGLGHTRNRKTNYYW